MVGQAAHTFVCARLIWYLDGQPWQGCRVAGLLVPVYRGKHRLSSGEPDRRHIWRTGSYVDQNSKFIVGTSSSNTGANSQCTWLAFTHPGQTRRPIALGLGKVPDEGQYCRASGPDGRQIREEWSTAPSIQWYREQCPSQGIVRGLPLEGTP